MPLGSALGFTLLSHPSGSSLVLMLVQSVVQIMRQWKRSL